LIVHALFERFDSFGPISEWLAPLPGKESLWIVCLMSGHRLWWLRKKVLETNLEGERFASAKRDIPVAHLA
jgi:hypothetical protein